MATTTLRHVPEVDRFGQRWPKETADEAECRSKTRSESTSGHCKQRGREPIRLKQIALRQGVYLSYLEHISLVRLSPAEYSRALATSAPWCIRRGTQPMCAPMSALLASLVASA